ncbi:MAG: ferrous iron transport protein A [Cellulosilyticum sp.]|nr:ferrous iron transport protein A [Cellulosilyticum sp.]
MKKHIPLTKLQEGQKGIVLDLQSQDAMRRRLQDLGVINGTAIECLQKGPNGDPVAYKIRGAIIALRSEDANKIIVTPKNM